ncbi:ACBP-domain-containing protein [Rhizopogon vinicolor AM-OR11-026]|uniref:ACBP-domain-containing protein n=1 Tax=Rhizopogon vinicolor AM-OR11-026 TaxID=1314800 RepID=A0A1B7NC82_9AGAM|nr:ACBP-domain-containing protein [Rhizopogon vinicolor AM-OR11-026]
MSSKFEKAVAYVQGLDKQGSGPDNDTKLEFYKYYKQATVGDADPAKEPSRLQFVERAKWVAWNGIKGMSKEDAKDNYVKQLIKVRYASLPVILHLNIISVPKGQASRRADPQRTRRLNYLARWVTRMVSIPVFCN